MPGTLGRTTLFLTPKSKSATLFYTLAVQGLILAAAGALLLHEARATELREIEHYQELHNDITPALIRERAPDLTNEMIAQNDSRLRPLLSQLHLDRSAVAWILDEVGAVQWALQAEHPQGANPSRNADPPSWATEGAMESDTEVRKGHADASGLIATRHRLPNGFKLIVVEPSPGGKMFAHASLLGVYTKTTVAGIGTLCLTAMVTLFIMRRYESQVERINAHLEDEVRHQVDASTQRLHAMIFGLAKLADFRDSDTGAHLDRICEYAVVLARELAREKPEIDDAWIEDLRLASSLHDIGKVGVPDGVLLKPGGLTQEERQVIEQHPIFGADTLIAVRRRLGDSPLLNRSIEIALGHHERWDGTGYPFGLAGEQISLSARIVAVADVYDALRSVRVYKPAMTHEQAAAVIRKGSGTHFDPALVRAFLRIEAEFAAIAERWAGTRPQLPVGLSDAA